MTVTGDVYPNPLVPNEDVSIGYQSIGKATIDAGSVLDSSNRSVQIGENSGGIGFATVKGPGSEWSIGGLTVGQYGVGRLDVLEGAIVKVNYDFDIGREQSGNGTVVVDGSTTVLQVQGNTRIGEVGLATLQVTNDAIVDVSGFDARIGYAGSVRIDQGLFRAWDLVNGGSISGTGQIQIHENYQFENYGRIEAHDGEKLTILGELDNYGAVAAESGEINFLSPVHMQPYDNNLYPRVTLRDGVVRVPAESYAYQGGLTNHEGSLMAIGGENDFYGNYYQDTFSEAVGTLVTNESLLIFHDRVEIDRGNFVVDPGSKVIFLGELYVEGQLHLTVGSGNAVVQLQASAGADLYGQIDIQLAEDYAPQVGDSFTLMTGSQIDGTLTPGSMASLPAGLVWDWNNSPTQVQLAIVAGLAGDFNNNGTVDAADYSVWRDALESGADELVNDPSPGLIDESDFDYWRAHFGEAFNPGAGAAAATAVPEPSTLLSLCIGFLFAPFCCRRRRTHLAIA